MQIIRKTELNRPNLKKRKKKTLKTRNTVATPQNTQWAAASAVHKNPLKTNTNLGPFVLAGL